MDLDCHRRIQSDWYSPTRLHDSPVHYDFPGDRFIPNRSLMDLDQARGELTNTNKAGPEKRSFKIEYRKRLENMTLNFEGRPFQMLVFRGSPKQSRKSQRLIDEIRRSDEELSDRKPIRRLQKLSESRILDAPNIRNDYYGNVLDWGKTNTLAVALDSKLYLWNAVTCKVCLLCEVNSERNYPSSLTWSEDAKTLAVGYQSSLINLYDPETLKLTRCLHDHRRKVGCIAWNGHTLTSGSSDGNIYNHDVRSKNSLTCHVKVHTLEVCGLKWSGTGNILASGGNDNLVYIWDACKMSSIHYVRKFKDHCAAVKALAWSPHNFDLLASGGGTNDGSLKIWNVQKGICINSIDTNAQISGLIWNRHHDEILSGHGYGSGCENQICLWKYPSLSKIEESSNHTSRVLHLSQSPDGLTVVSAGADETLRFWEVFGPAKDVNSNITYLESLLSFKTCPLR